ncbi:hypothetical protein HN51_028853 [Arachis hypogaea]|uniref:Glutaredoxin domain-containing protein n=2 Tax=Arachis TaxID=3817 RepID=A0A445BGV1_ARAHY|nr:uncharacterized protein LOC107466499 [Arachis duranensis]XP_025619896.1 uncharacterized protein LOC112711450 [Arachis hypogaea]QHO35414.1 uncharacterized protein DS421_9g275250 [Arachis hypogaea]RYR37912.1 hypothetical protein Ahy_A09g042829 [Arachis hypogaea]
MRGVKGKLLKKLKSIKPIESLRHDRILQVKASDGYVDFLQKIPTFNLSSPFLSRENAPKKVVVVQKKGHQEEQPEVIDVSELMKDLKDDDEEIDLDDYNDNKENIGPCSLKSNHQFGHKGISENGFREETERNQSKKQSKILVDLRSSEPRSDFDGKNQTPLSEIDVASFRRPDLNSGSLFDPNLLAAFEEAVREYVRMTEEQRRARAEAELLEKSCNIVEEIGNCNCDSNGNGDGDDPLLCFEEKCPPGGESCVIFYTTTLRGIRKTFEDCEKIRFLLESFKVLYFERDISMHKEFKAELWETLGGKIVPPRLFVKGRHIGGAEEVVTLHEQGKLKQIFEGIPKDCSNGPCDGCGGIRFVLCFICNGSHKIIEEHGEKIQCSKCNENGLITCPYCSS